MVGNISTSSTMASVEVGGAEGVPKGSRMISGTCVARLKHVSLHQMFRSPS